MFDVRHVEEVANEIYSTILEREDVAQWYEDEFYDESSCWDRASADAMDYLALGGCEITDLMAWVIGEQCESGTAWKDGFGYLLGSLLASRYEDENFEEE